MLPHSKHSRHSRPMYIIMRATHNARKLKCAARSQASWFTAPPFKATKYVLKCITWLSDSQTAQYKYKLITKLLIIYASLQLLRQSLSMIVCCKCIWLQIRKNAANTSYRPLRARTHQLQFSRNRENRKTNFSWSLKIGQVADCGDKMLMMLTIHFLIQLIS